MSNEQDNEIIDLGLDVTADEMKRPVAKPGNYPMEVVKTFQKTSKNGNRMVVVEYRNTEEIPATDGTTLAAGRLVVFQNYLRDETGGLTQQMINDRFKQIQFATNGPGTVNTGTWVGKVVKAKVKLREAEGEYGASNEVDGVYPLAKK